MSTKKASGSKMAPRLQYMAVRWNLGYSVTQPANPHIEIATPDGYEKLFECLLEGSSKEDITFLGDWFHWFLENCKNEYSYEMAEVPTVAYGMNTKVYSLIVSPVMIFRVNAFRVPRVVLSGGKSMSSTDDGGKKLATFTIVGNHAEIQEVSEEAANSHIQKGKAHLVEAEFSRST
ncbi:TPA_asm: M [Kobresia betacytorhabdovirus 1]|nr:TPA_asm: M [Kobresia betacytorhabdovirus 1]